MPYNTSRVSGLKRFTPTPSPIMNISMLHARVSLAWDEASRGMRGSHLWGFTHGACAARGSGKAVALALRLLRVRPFGFHGRSARRVQPPFSAPALASNCRSCMGKH